MGQLGKGRDDMKKFLVVTLVVMMAVASGFAETAKTPAAFVNKAAVQKAAAAIKPTPLIAVAGTATAGYLPMFTDAAGDVTNSKLFELDTTVGGIPTTYYGIGTATPAFNLDIVSALDPAAITVEGFGNVGVNFIGQRAEGVPGHPTSLLANDNIMTMQGRGYGSTGYSSLSRASMKFFAAEAWTDAAQGTYITLATTPTGSVNGGGAAPERLRITAAGLVGIGTSAPDQMLTVAGAVHSTAGGFIFPGGTTQLVAAGLPTSDGSILVTGTLTAPALAVNTALIQARVGGTCTAGSAMTGVTATGGVTYGTIGAGGTAANVPVVETLVTPSLTGGSGLSAASTIFTADTTGFYRVSVYMNSPAGGTCSSAPCTGEQIVLTWSDGISTGAQATTTCSLAGPCGSSFSAPIWVAAGQNIQAYSQTTGSGTAPSGTFNAYFLVEKL